MRILVITPGNLPVPPSKGGSVETVIDEVFSRLAKIEDITVIGCKIPEMNEQEKEVIQRDYHRIEIEYTQSSTYIAKALTEVSSQSFDVIQVDNRPTYIPKIREAFPGTPIILTLHSLTFMDKLKTLEEANHILSKLDGVITVSNFLANAMKKRYPDYANLFHPIHLGVDSDKFHPLSDEEKLHLREKWMIKRKANGMNILFIGRIVPKKGLHTLIRAVALLKRKYPRIRIIIVGSSWPGKSRETAYIKKVKKLFRKQRISHHFTGYIPPKDIQQLYHLGDIFVLPTQFEEGFPMVNLEAMASGITVVSSNRGGIREAIEHKKSGLLVSSYKNPKAFAKAIEQLLNHPKFTTKLSKTAREHVVSNFSWNKTIKGYRKYYSDIKRKR